MSDSYEMFLVDNGWTRTGRDEWSHPRRKQRVSTITAAQIQQAWIYRSRGI